MAAGTHTLSVLAGTYAVCRLDAGAPVPDWAAAAAPFTSVTRTAEELSITCPEARVPAGVTAGRGLRCLRLEGPFDLDQPGVIAAIVGPLAGAGLSAFVVATYDTDYVLVHDLPAARDALTAAGHRVVDAPDEAGGGR